MCSFVRYHLLENTVIDIKSYSRDLLEDRRRFIMNDYNGVVRLNDIRRDITTDMLGCIWAKMDYCRDVCHGINGARIEHL
ncbi:unnamed protein product [Timema podura]|uniref:Uncharacterized protein n=1 Tax=Timema podura TaxID=61482 RepID=A0ABN7P8T2_TIMPD|nr:unnamed protein product [Timema podura]